jgi:IS6 family transposase
LSPRIGRRGRPRHHLPISAAIHPAVRRRCRPLRHATGDRWFVDETYVKVAGRWRYLYRAVDQYGQVIDVLLSEQRDTAAARKFFARASTHGPAPVEVTTDKAGPSLRVLAEVVPTAAHVTDQYSNNRIEADHSRLKARVRPMRGLKRLRSAARIAAGHAFVQNLRRGHYELATEVRHSCASRRHSPNSHSPSDPGTSRPELAHPGPTQQRHPAPPRPTAALETVLGPLPQPWYRTVCTLDIGRRQR